MIYEDCRRHRRLIRNFSLLIKIFFPSISPLEAFGVWCVRHNYTTRNMPGVKWLKSTLRIHITALIPQLNPNFLSIYLENLEWEISVDALVRRGSLFGETVWYRRAIRNAKVRNITFQWSVRVQIELSSNSVGCVRSGSSHRVTFLLVQVENLDYWRFSSKFLSYN